MIYLTMILIMITIIIIHEIGHILAIYITKAGYVTGFVLNFKVAGVKWEWNGDYRKRFLVTMSGPITNIIVGILLWGTLFGDMNIMFGLLNLLIPIKVSDGYRAIQSLKMIKFAKEV